MEIPVHIYPSLPLHIHLTFFDAHAHGRRIAGDSTHRLINEYRKNFVLFDAFSPQSARSSHVLPRLSHINHVRLETYLLYLSFRRIKPGIERMPFDHLRRTIDRVEISECDALDNTFVMSKFIRHRYLFYFRTFQHQIINAKLYCAA